MNKTPQSLAVLTSGGDSPGMNAAIRSIVRTAVYHGIKVWGIERGYQGLIENQMSMMDVSSVGNIIQRGGTILHSSRSEDFRTPAGRKKAAQVLHERKIDGLIVIGGDGSYNGANQLFLEQKVPVIGIPGTIDNDITGTDYTIGFDTALHTAIEAVDKIRDTAFSHERTFIVEVMGRNSSSLAVHVGIGTGAENIVLPHDEIDYASIAHDISRGIKRGKKSSIIIVAEGKTEGRSYLIQKILKEKFQLPAHVCILGHIQRGGSPGPLDRFMAAMMGNMAVTGMIENNFPAATCYDQGKVVLKPLEACLQKKNFIAESIVQVSKTLSI